MIPNFKNTAILLSLVLTIYLMRQEEITPARFLKQQILRITQQERVSDLFCENVDTSTFTEAEEAEADDYRSSIRHIRNDHTLASYIEDGEPKGQFVSTYVKAMIPYMIPWMIFLVLGLVGCIYYVTNWCCMNCYLCKNCCRRVCGKPKTNKYSTGYAAFSIVLMLFTIGCGIAGIIYSAKIPKYANATICLSVRFVETIEYGSPEDNWVGLGPGTTTANNIISAVAQIGSGLGTFNTIFAELKQNIDNTSVSIDNVFQSNRDSTLPRANPSQDQPYTPNYIQNLGPRIRPTSITGMLSVELLAKRTVVYATDSTLGPIITEVQDDIDQIVSAVEGEIPVLQQVSDSIIEGLDNVADKQSTIDTVIDAIYGVLLGLFIANLSVAAVALVSIVLVCFGANLFNKTIHLSWCVMGLLMLVGWIISIGLYGATIFLYEACDVGDQALTDPVFFNQTFDTLNYIFELSGTDYETTKDIVYTCVHGNGDISSEFNLQGTEVYFNEAFTDINRIYQLATTITDSIPASVVLPLQENALNNLKAGYIPDSQETIDDLASLNSLTNSDANTCTQIADTWILNSANCTEPSGTVFMANNPADFNLPDPTCLGFNAWMANNHDISNRYQLTEFPQPACGIQDNMLEHIYLRSFVNGFVTNRDENTLLINNVLDDLNVVKLNNLEFTVELQKFPVGIAAVNASVATIYNAVFAENTGLVSTLNCNFVVESFTEILDVGCTGLGNGLFQTMLVNLIMSFMTFFGTFMLFCLAKRFVVGKGKRKGTQIEMGINRKKKYETSSGNNDKQGVSLAPSIAPSREDL